MLNTFSLVAAAVAEVAMVAVAVVAEFYLAAPLCPLALTQ
jgi:hypothetical protein